MMGKRGTGLSLRGIKEGAKEELEAVFIEARNGSTIFDSADNNNGHGIMTMWMLCR